MVICLCKGVSDKKIHQLIASGAKSLRDIMASCQAGSDCGSCVCAVKEMLQTQRAAGGNLCVQPADDTTLDLGATLDRAANE